MTKSNVHSEEDVARTIGLAGSRGRKSRLVGWLMLFGLAAAALAGWMLWQGRGRTEAVQYVTQPVRRGDLVVTVSATGTVEPLKEVDVGIEVSGTIKTVEVDYNDQVKVGQVLARLDTAKLEAQVLQSRAALEAARAKVAQAQASVQEALAQLARLNQVLKLSGGKTPSQSDLDAAKATLARARADEASARASVTQAEAILNGNLTDLSKAVIHSPIDGVVLTRSVEPGQTVAASYQAPVLFTLAEDLRKMELQVDVDEADVGQVREGQEAAFTVDAYPDRNFPAQITQVRYGSSTVDGVVTYKAVLKVDNSSLALRPGMTATAVITVNKREKALLVPNAALRFTPPQTAPAGQSSGGGLLGALLPRPPRHDSKSTGNGNSKGKETRVWTLHNGRLAAVAVTCGATDGLLTEVTGGPLAEGLALVTDTVAAK